MAHIVEHLAFCATKDYKNHDLVHFLETIGSKFGPCQNAYTTLDETVYEILVPVDKPEILSKALHVLAEFSTEVSLHSQTLLLLEVCLELTYEDPYLFQKEYSFTMLIDFFRFKHPTRIWRKKEALCWRNGGEDGMHLVDLPFHIGKSCWKALRYDVNNYEELLQLL